MNNYRLHGDNKALYQMQYERDPYSQKQNFLYKQAVYGLSAYKQHQLKVMNPAKKKNIIANHKKTQRILNTLKQKKTNEITNLIFKDLFPNSSLVNDIVTSSKLDKHFINKLSFKELGINKKDIIHKLIVCSILPEDFIKL
jgi:hypothetical protein